MEFGKGSSSSSYYGVLGVSADSSDEEIRRAYRKLAMQWHPDKWTRTPALLGEAKQRFQQIQEAYSVLSDQNKRTLYDAGLYDPHDEEDEVEGFADFVQEMVSLMNDVKREEKSYSIEELQGMFWEMAQGFETPMCSGPEQPTYESQLLCGTYSLYDHGAERTNSSWEPSMFDGNPHTYASGFGSFGEHRFCR